MKQNLLLLFALFSFTSLFSQSQRTVFLEEFTQASCPPCEASTPAMDAIVGDNIDKIVQIRYQTSWPGVDPMNADNPQDVQARVDYYGVTGVPTFLIDGVRTTGDQSVLDFVPTQEEIDASYASGAPILMKVEHKLSDNLASIDITVTISNEGADDYVPGMARLRVALTEEAITWDSPPGSTNISKFEAVMKTFFTGPGGMDLPTIPAGETWEMTWTDLAIPYTIYDANTLGVVGFVQDDATQAVHNAGYSEPQELTGDYGSVSTFTDAVASANLCDYSYTPSVTVVNTGAKTVQNYTVGFWVNGNLIESVVVSDMLTAGDLSTTNFADYTFDSGASFVNYSVELEEGDIFNHDNLTPTVVANKISATAAANLESDFESTASGTLPTNIINQLPASLSNNAIVLNGAELDANPYGAFGQSEGAMRVNFYQWDPSVFGESGSIVVSEKLMVESTGRVVFDYAFTNWQNSQDAMAVEVSTDCGSSYAIVWEKSGNELATAASLNLQNQFFVPAVADWRREVVDLSDYAGQEVLVRFSFISAWGDMLYLDNINASAVSDLNDLTINEELSVYPNPVSNNLNIELTLENSEVVRYDLVNMMGQVVRSAALGIQASGSFNETIDVSDLENGSYLLHFLVGDRQVVERVTIVH